MKKLIPKAAFAAIMVILLGISIVTISPCQGSKSEELSSAETRSICTSIKGFTKAKDLKERMRYASDSADIQKKMRTYLVVPFSNREIIDEKITIGEFSDDLKTGKKFALVDQELSYLSKNSEKSHKLKITYKLEKDGEWRISDFEVSDVGEPKD